MGCGTVKVLVVQGAVATNFHGKKKTTSPGERQGIEVVRVE